MTKSQKLSHTMKLPTDSTNNVYDPNNLEYYKNLFNNEQITTPTNNLISLLQEKYILHKAVEATEIELVNKILEFAAFLTDFNRLKNGYNVLHTALNCPTPNIEMIKILLNKNALLIHDQDEEQLTPTKFWEKHGSSKKLPDKQNSEISEVLEFYERTAYTLEEILDDIELIG